MKNKILFWIFDFLIVSILYTMYAFYKIKKYSKKVWGIWAKTMGCKISDCDIESDIAAIIRTFWWFVHIITCGFIIANAIHHWNE